MSVFSYTALSKDGQRTSGTVTSDSRSSAIAEMSKKGLRPLVVEEAKDLGAAAAKKSRTTASGEKPRRISTRSIEAFTRELANLLAGGVPLARSLALLRREASQPAAKQLWSDIHDDVVGGTALADALAKWPRSFSTVYIAMVRAGEAGGFLDVVLNQIADFRAREQDLKGKVKAAMVYPIILGCLAVAVVIFLMTFFIPRFSGIFAQFGGNLPLITQFVIACSHILQHYAPIVVAVLVIGFFTFKRIANTESGRRRIEMVVLGTPLLGHVTAQFALVRFARMLGTLLGAGVPLVASLRVAREAIGNQILADTVSRAIEQVQRGEPLSKSLAASPKLFPMSVIEMIAVAEETARLDKELMRLASAYELDLDRQLRMLVAVVEPLMLFVMAALIGTVVISMLLPVFSIGDLIH
ncbi:MAG TPA: type II secretion system F family protein [Tepidisphaeraceae bacterium]|jgi:type II secretory pathway component PulF|nr:type II secretion system F family protein [Tepidisphaeraceae bacterium]